MKKFLVGLLLLLAGTASAGVLEVKDGEGILRDRAGLEQAVASLPFDVRLVTSSKISDRGQFNRMVEGEVKDANSVVVGVDSVHRWSRIRLGGNVRVPLASLDAIAAYGNPYFKTQKYKEGLQAIVEGIGRSVVPVPSVSAVPARPLPEPVPAPEESESNGIGWLIFGILEGCALVGVVIYVLGKRQEKREEEERRARVLANARFNERMLYKDYVAPVVRTNYPGAYAPAPRPIATYVPPPQPVVVTHNNNNPVLDYLLIDHLVNSSHQPAPAHTPDPEPYRAPYRAPDPEPTPSYSSGGSDYSSSSSYDSGSSSFDSGSSSDSGGSSW